MSNVKIKAFFIFTMGWGINKRMSAFAKWAVSLVLPTVLWAGCVRTVPPPVPQDAKSPGVTLNTGGDTRGTVLYDPALSPPPPPNPYAAVSDKIVLPERQKIAWELAEIDLHAHLQAAKAYPVPTPASPNYSKRNARDAAERQAEFNAYLLEKYRARFCNQFRVTYDQIALISEEGRDKNWPMPPSLPN